MEIIKTGGWPFVGLTVPKTQLKDDCLSTRSAVTGNRHRRSNEGN